MNVVTFTDTLPSSPNIVAQVLALASNDGEIQMIELVVDQALNDLPISDVCITSDDIEIMSTIAMVRYNINNLCTEMLRRAA